MAKGFAPVPPPTVSPSFKRFKHTILDELKGLNDPRNKRKPKHLLGDIVTIAILATLGGADNMVAVETYGREKQDWLASMNGVALRDSLSRYTSQNDYYCQTYLLILAFGFLPILAIACASLGTGDSPF